MPDTLKNITVSPNEWIDLYSESGIAAGTQIAVENIGSSDIYLYSGETPPTNNITHAHNVLRRNDANMLTNSNGDAGAWAYSQSIRGLVSVSDVGISNGFYPLSLSKRVYTASESLNQIPLPISQISAQYGVMIDSVATAELGGVATAVNGEFVCDSGSSLGGRATISSRRGALYRPGQPLRGKFSALFDDGIAGNIQAAGIFNFGNGFFFGYQDDVFGITHTYNGVPELQKLTITDGAIGSADVTINGLTYTVTTTTSDESQNAYDIASQLDGIVDGYSVTSNGTVVTAVSDLSSPQGSFSFSSSSIVASWAQVKAGAFPTVNFYPQEQWNKNKCAWLDPSKGNVYTIRFKYLGFEGVEFYMQEPNTSLPILVHTVDYLNVAVEPVVSNPNFNIGWFSWNLSGTAGRSVKGASAGLFIEGSKVKDTRRNAISANASGIGSATTSLLIIRNRSTFRDLTNLIEVLPKRLGAAAQANKPMFFDIYINPVFAEPVNFQYYDENESVVEFSFDNVEIIGGGIFESFTVSVQKNTEFNIDNENEEIIEPREVLAIAARTSSGSAGDVQLSFVWQEDY